MSTFLNVVLVILVIAAIVLAVLYFLGRKLEKRQVEQEQLLEASKQVVSMLVIDKKKMKIKDAGLPKMVYEQTPKYMRWAKVPVVKAKVGPKVMTLMADERAFQMLPVKTEAKVVVSGIYITEVKSVRGGIPTLPPKKKGFFARFKKEKKADKEFPAFRTQHKTDIRIPTNEDSDIRFLIPQKGFPLQLLQLQTCSLSGTYIQHNTAVRNMIIINIQRIIHRYLQAVLILLQLNPIR